MISCARFIFSGLNSKGTYIFLFRKIPPLLTQSHTSLKTYLGVIIVGVSVLRDSCWAFDSTVRKRGHIPQKESQTFFGK